MKKKLIEVALPLDAINKASTRENYIYRGNPSSIHKWWAQRPLAVARAVIFAQMVDDPSAYPDLFPTEKAQDKERKRLFKIIEELVKWENTTNENVLQHARDEIWTSWRRTCAENVDHPKAKILFDRYKLPAFHDPFAGGGTLPLEAQRLGFETYASDLNPVAVLICKSLLEIPPMFADTQPVNPEWQNKTPEEKAMITWRGAQGLSEDVRYYGKWIRDNAEKRIGHFYPKVEITKEMLKDRPDLKQYVGEKLTVIAWFWVRTVNSPNPAFKNVKVPLASTFMLSTKPGKEVYLKPIIEGSKYSFIVKIGKPKNSEEAKHGTKLARGANFKCLMSDTPISGDYIKTEAMNGRMGLRMMAIAVDGPRGRIYLQATPEMENLTTKAKPEWKPEIMISGSTQYIGVKLYGMEQFCDLFTNRQLVALTTLSDLVKDTRKQVLKDMNIVKLSSDYKKNIFDEKYIMSYADTISLYISFAIGKHAMYGNSLVPWYTKEDRPSMLFTQQVLPMVWDPVEINPFCEVGGSFTKSITIVSSALDGLPYSPQKSIVSQKNATVGLDSPFVIISTDPPYYDNVPYADLSDFFYVWLRRALKNVFPDMFLTVSVPKTDELVAFAYRHNNSKHEAELFFLEGMTAAMQCLALKDHPAFPVTIYYAFKQTELKTDHGVASTGWETFLEAVIRAGFTIEGTWPIRTERTGRMRDYGSNALASSIIIVCRKRASDLPIITRRDFNAVLKSELPKALIYLQRSNIAPVDLAQSAIGPGMAAFTRYEKIIDAEGKHLAVHDALALINQILDETLEKQEGDFDNDSRWALAWFDQYGFNQGEYGVAETLSKAKNTSVSSLAQDGFLISKAGKVRLLKPEELPANWDPKTDSRLTNWEMVHHLIRVLVSNGESEAAELVAKLGSKAETARELCYRLYTICERKKRAAEALSYNGLVQSWPEISRLAADLGRTKESKTPQGELF
ncbi:MAG: DUF1156 domain-containing protein [Syntrophaceae bacterium]|nr:DUF1156 domain-containing protein [Syntrophaceae bacterium]